VNLCGYINLSDRTGEYIQSYERECSVMLFTIFADEHTFHEPHVGLKRQGAREPGTGACSTDAVQADETLEITNLRRIGKTLQRHPRREDREMVDEDTER